LIQTALGQARIVEKRRLGTQGLETSALGLGCVELTDEALTDLEAVVQKGAAAGGRYADMSPINR